jgi:hypothetical protein
MVKSSSLFLCRVSDHVFGFRWNGMPYPKGGRFQKCPFGRGDSGWERRKPTLRVRWPSKGHLEGGNPFRPLGNHDE